MRKLLGIAAVVAALTVGAAQAGELAFTITGAGHIITFDLPQNPTPDSSSSGEFFTFDSVNGAFDGTPTVYAGATFWNPDQDTGNLHLDFFSPYFGDILYTGAESTPTFKTGVFDYVLTIAAVPEVSTWTLMLLGFAGLGIAGWRRSMKAA
jgi:hypothetical protein